MQDKSTHFSDYELLQRVNAGDKAAFKEVYSRFSQVVYNLSIRILRDREDAEEVVQEIFLQIWNKASSYDRNKGALSTWIINIARSRAIDKLRTLKKNLQNTEFTEEKIPSDTDFSRIIESRDKKRKIIAEALYALPEKQRLAIETVYFMGLTHVETAEKLGEPVGTIKTRIRLGVMKLKDKILPYIEELD